MQIIIIINCPECKIGKLEVIAKTQPGYGTQDGELFMSTFFLHCNHCEQIYRAEGNEKDDSYIKAEKRPYEGSLIKEEIIEHIPGQKGYFTGFKEKDILKKIANSTTK